MPKEGEAQEADILGGRVFSLLGLLAEAEWNNRTWGSRFGTFYQDRNNRRTGSGQMKKNVRNTDKILLHCPLHNCNYHKKNVVFSSLTH